MKTGAYIVDRLLPEFVKQAARTQAITCESLSDDWVLRLEKAGTIRWILGYQFDVNKAAASALAQDKVATHLLLQSAQIPSIEHFLVRSLPHEPVGSERFTEIFMGKPFVLKPLDGTGGRGVQKMTDPQDAVKTILQSGEVAWAASPFYIITNEYRIILLNGTPLATYEKTNPVTLHDMPFYNLGLGALAVDIEDAALEIQLIDLARASTTAAALHLASVDIVKTSDGSLKILEINDGIMMENYARQSEQYKNRTAQVYDAIVSAMFS